MQYLVIFTPQEVFEVNGLPSDFIKLEADEEAQARVLYGKGGLRQVWALDRKAKGAAVLFEAESSQDLQQMIDSFPLIKVDYVDYQVWALKPYPAFANA